MAGGFGRAMPRRARLWWRTTAPTTASSAPASSTAGTRIGAWSPAARFPPARATGSRWRSGCGLKAKEAWFCVCQPGTPRAKRWTGPIPSARRQAQRGGSRCGLGCWCPRGLFGSNPGSSAMARSRFGWTISRSAGKTVRGGNGIRGCRPPWQCGTHCWRSPWTPITALWR